MLLHMALLETSCNTLEIKSVRKKIVTFKHPLTKHYYIAAED